MKNIEFKAELRDLELAKAIAMNVGAKRAAVLLQTDEYVRVPEGRLKRRVERNDAAGAVRELWIWYDRPDRTGPRASRWTSLDDRQVEVRWPGLDRTVARLIIKRREVWSVENIRIHLDAVAGLGNYLELHGIVDHTADPGETRLKVTSLMEQFRPALGEPVSGSYSELGSRESP